MEIETLQLSVQDQFRSLLSSSQRLNQKRKQDILGWASTKVVKIQEMEPDVAADISSTFCENKTDDSSAKKNLMIM